MALAMSEMERIRTFGRELQAQRSENELATARLTEVCPLQAPENERELT